jgi:hypothetical protein
MKFVICAMMAAVGLGACATTPAQQLAANNDACAVEYVGNSKRLIYDSFGSCVTEADYAAKRREVEERDRYQARKWRQRNTNAVQSTPYDADEGVRIGPQQY